MFNSVEPLTAVNDSVGSLNELLKKCAINAASDAIDSRIKVARKFERMERFAKKRNLSEIRRGEIKPLAESVKQQCKAVVWKSAMVRRIPFTALVHVQIYSTLESAYSRRTTFEYYTQVQHAFNIVQSIFSRMKK